MISVAFAHLSAVRPPSNEKQRFKYPPSLIRGKMKSKEVMSRERKYASLQGTIRGAC